MFFSQSHTNLGTIPLAISGIKKYFSDPNLVTIKNSLNALDLSEFGDRYDVKQITNCK